MQMSTEAVESDKTGNPASTKQYFINDEKYLLLKQYQQAIFEATQVSPALRKIVDEVINIENLDKVKAKFISILE